MISKMVFKDHKDMPITWWDELKEIHKLNEIKFTPGLNVIVGPNGIG